MYYSHNEYLGVIITIRQKKDALVPDWRLNADGMRTTCFSDASIFKKYRQAMRVLKEKFRVTKKLPITEAHHVYTETLGWFEVKEKL